MLSFRGCLGHDVFVPAIEKWLRKVYSSQSWNHLMMSFSKCNHISERGISVFASRRQTKVMNLGYFVSVYSNREVVRDFIPGADNSGTNGEYAPFMILFMGYPGGTTWPQCLRRCSHQLCLGLFSVHSSCFLLVEVSAWPHPTCFEFSGLSRGPHEPIHPDVPTVRQAAGVHFPFPKSCFVISFGLLPGTPISPVNMLLSLFQ